MSLNRDGHRLVSAETNWNGPGWKQIVKVWDVASWTEICALNLSSLPSVYCAAFSPENDQLALGHSDDITIWDVKTETKLRTLRGHA